MRLVARLRYLVRLVSPDHVCTRGGAARAWAVGHDFDDVVVMVVAEVGGDTVVQGCGVGEVQRDEGEVALSDEHGEGALVAGPDNTCALGRAAAAGRRRQDDVAGAGPSLPPAPGGQVVLREGRVLNQQPPAAAIG